MWNGASSKMMLVLQCVGSSPSRFISERCLISPLDHMLQVRNQCCAIWTELSLRDDCRSMPATADLAEEMNAVLAKVDSVSAQEVHLYRGVSGSGYF
jgi:hypothetical protein